MRNNIVKLKNAATSMAGKVTAGATALVASGAALASGGSSPGAAISGELAGGKQDVMLIIGAVAVILGALIVWGYVKRAR